MPIADQLRDFFERYVAARARVVELAICVLLDKVSLRGCCHRGAHSNAVRYVLPRRALCGGFDMATRKRASSRTRRTGLVGRAVKAGRKALRQAESRVP